MLLALLEVIDCEVGHFAPPQATAEHQSQNRPVAATLQLLNIGSLEQSPTLFCRQPIPQADADSFGALHAPDACRQVGAEESGICGLIGKPAYRRQTQFYR